MKTPHSRRGLADRFVREFYRARRPEAPVRQAFFDRAFVHKNVIMRV
jgi:hypothetical protein